MPEKIETNRQKSRAYYHAHRDEIRASWKKNKHGQRYMCKRRMGITYEQYLTYVEDLTKKQDNKCAICGQTKKLGLDHNHKTKFIRGLLCHSCNVAIGFLQENVIYLKSAINYLKKYS